MNRQSEIRVYENAYRNQNYKMGDRRKKNAEQHIATLERGSLLDVGTGRGELLDIAEAMGFSVQGTEVVPYLIDGDRVRYAEAHSLPFETGAFDHVVCFDVMEHLVEEDIIPALTEMYRVARKTCTVSCSEMSSIYQSRELHISKRPASEWFQVIVQCWGEQAMMIGHAGRSPCFQVEK